MIMFLPISMRSIMGMISYMEESSKADYRNGIKRRCIPADFTRIVLKQAPLPMIGQGYNTSLGY